MCTLVCACLAPQGVLSSIYADLIYINTFNQVYFHINMYKNEQKVPFTVIHVQGNHVHIKALNI